MRRLTHALVALLVMGSALGLAAPATATVGAQDVVMQTDTATNTTTDSAGEDPPDEPQTAGELWNNYRAFVAAVVLGFAAIGMWGRSLTVGAFVAYLAFAYIAITTETTLLQNILYVTIVLVFLGFAFKLWRLEFGGE